MSAAVVSATVFAALAALFTASRAPGDSDMWWHLASGAWMLDHGAILERDVFSYTRAGTEYRSGQWLGQVVLELAFRGGGWPGIVALRAALVGTSAFFLARATLRLQPHAGWAAVPILATLLVSSTTWGDRPQLWTVAFFPLVLDTLLAVRLGASPRRLAILPPLFLLWGNLHAGATAGLALVAIAAAEAVWSRVPPARALVLTGAVAAGLSLLDPFGSGAVGRGPSYLLNPPGHIVEERPVSPTSGAGLTFIAVASAALVAAAAIRLRGATVPAARLWPMLAVPFAVLGLMIQRQLPLACVVLAPFVAAAVPLALGRPPATLPPRLPRGAARIAVTLAAATTAAVVVLTAPRAPDVEAYPAAAIPALATLRGNVLNEYDWGGYLIREAPATPVFIDGRGPLLFEPDVLADLQEMVHARPGHADALRRWDIAIALLRPDRPLVPALTRAGWRPVIAGERFVLLARP